MKSLSKPEPARVPSIEVDAAWIAKGLGMTAQQFQALMQQGRIRSLSERGVDADSGRYRFTFYYQAARFRFVTDAAGKVLDQARPPAS